MTSYLHIWQRLNDPILKKRNKLVQIGGVNENSKQELGRVDSQPHFDCFISLIVIFQRVD